MLTAILPTNAAPSSPEVVDETLTFGYTNSPVNKLDKSCYAIINY